MDGCIIFTQIYKIVLLLKTKLLDGNWKMYMYTMLHLLFTPGYLSWSCLPYGQKVTSHKSTYSQIVTALIILCYRLVLFGSQLHARLSHCIVKHTKVNLSHGSDNIQVKRVAEKSELTV